MCIFPPGGVFTDVWPAWMIQWPRAVVAEGTLDVARLAYADPQLALRAALSLFRDTTADNIPCIFQHGEPNMVAADGSVCGTSPAWCVPFYNLERLFLGIEVPYQHRWHKNPPGYDMRHNLAEIRFPWRLNNNQALVNSRSDH
jgi:hypothetical protein